MNVYLIIGDDDYLISETVKKIIGDVGDGLEVIDSLTSSNEELQLRDIRNAEASYFTPPFLDPIKVTWWKNVGFLPGGAKDPSERNNSGDEKRQKVGEFVKTALEKLAKKIVSSPLPDNQKFIISAKKLLQTSVFAKTMKSGAEIKIFATGKNSKEKLAIASERANEFAPQFGLKFGPQAAELFASRIGTDTRTILNELAKMRDYLAGEKNVISCEDVDIISARGVGVEPEMWFLTDAIGDRNFAKVAAGLRQIEDDKGYAIIATTVIEKCFRQLLEVKDASAKGKFAVIAKGMNPYTAQKLSRQSSNWTINELRSARSKFVDLREKAVSSAGDVGVLVMAAMSRLCQRK